MHKHAANASAAGIPADVKKEDLQWMSQWSEEEELMADYSVQLRDGAVVSREHVLHVLPCCGGLGLRLVRRLNIRDRKSVV